MIDSRKPPMCGCARPSSLYFASSTDWAAHGGAVRGAVRSGQALLVGLLRCGHCGRKLHVEYPSQGHTRYACMSSRLDPDGVCCVRTNGVQADELVSEEILRCLSPLGIEA